MVTAPRCLYGLHERFVLLPYLRGAKRCRLLLRVPALRVFCTMVPMGKETVNLGAPFVLGELLRLRAGAMPTVVTGAQIDNIKRFGAMEWYFRHYRVSFLNEDEFRFEAGNKTVYAAHTSYYAREFILALCDNQGTQCDPRARLL